LYRRGNRPETLARPDQVTNPERLHRNLASGSGNEGARYEAKVVRQPGVLFQLTAASEFQLAVLGQVPLEHPQLVVQVRIRLNLDATAEEVGVQKLDEVVLLALLCGDDG
jgi:hypothetical protein